MYSGENVDCTGADCNGAARAGAGGTGAALVDADCTGTDCTGTAAPTSVYFDRPSTDAAEIVTSCKAFKHLMR